jgi:hypothetical protein
MNTLRLTPYIPDASSLVCVLIDDIDLITPAQAVEQPYAGAEDTPYLAGGYVELSVNELVTRRRLWGDDAFWGERGDRVALLVSGCGEEGCWPLVAHIAIADDIVTWSDFEQPHRPHWDLGQFGPFVFERKQYDAAIAKLVHETHV